MSLEGKRAPERGQVRGAAFLPALSGRHEEMSERVPKAALVRFILICTDEPCRPRPGNHQPAPAPSAEPPPPNERRADQQWELACCHHTLAGSSRSNLRPLKRRRFGRLWEWAICVPSSSARCSGKVPSSRWHTALLITFRATSVLSAHTHQRN